MSERISLGRVLGTNEDLYVDAMELITGRTFISAVSGYGKSYLVRLIAERTGGKAQIGIIDRDGEYASLREKFKYFLIIGQDVPLQLETAEFLAQTILDEGLSFIIDLSTVEDEEYGKEYVKLFFNRLIHLETTMRKPLLTIVEEADEFCPQGGVSSQTCLATMKNLAKKGRKRGMGAIFITQRPAFVSKNVLSQCTKIKLIGHTEWQSDLDAIEEFLQVPQSILRRPKDKGEPINDGKPHIDCLEPGQFYVSGTSVKKPCFFMGDRVETTHLGSDVVTKIIPAAPTELKQTIEKLNAKLPTVIAKITPVVTDVSAIRAEAEKKANTKFAEKFSRDVASAETKIEAKYKDRLDSLSRERDELTKNLQTLSQKASLTTPPTTIDDVMQHPIVDRVMRTLDAEAQNLLTRIERASEQNRQPTREDLAAFLTSSSDKVKRIVDNINQSFGVDVIVSEGRPVRYTCKLRRLYLEDVAKREIEYLKELEQKNTELSQANTTILGENKTLKTSNQTMQTQLKTYFAPDYVNNLREQLRAANEALKVSVAPELVKELKKKISNLQSQVQTYEQAIPRVIRVTKLIQGYNEKLGVLLQTSNDNLNLLLETTNIQFTESQPPEPAPQLSSKLVIPEIPEFQPQSDLPSPASPILQPASPIEAPKLIEPVHPSVPSHLSSDEETILTFLKRCRTLNEGYYSAGELYFAPVSLEAAMKFIVDCITNPRPEIEVTPTGETPVGVRYKKESQ